MATIVKLGYHSIGKQMVCVFGHANYDLTPDLNLEYENCS